MICPANTLQYRGKSLKVDHRLLPEKGIVIRVASNPEPEDITAIHCNTQSPLTDTCANRPVSADSFQMERRVMWIVFQQRKIFICNGFDFFRERVILFPKGRTGIMIHSIEHLPESKSLNDSFANESNVPFVASS